MSVKPKSSEVTKEEFIEVLKKARDKAGSTFKLSLLIGVHPRRIMYWIKGDGPADTTIKETYEKLKAV